MGNLTASLRYKEPSTVEECDSTWDSDSEGEGDGGVAEEPLDAARQVGAPLRDDGPSYRPTPRRTELFIHQSSSKMKRSFYAAKDLYKYRHSYPVNYKEPRQPHEYRNLRFYLNKIPLVPDGIYVEEILTKWRGDYDQLEHNHTYIQWLFPLREQGLNFFAQELTQDEIKEFQSTREAKRRFLMAYTIMLDFFGIKLVDKSGNVARAANWQDRFRHLNESQHNYLRITRILKSLGELGFEAFKPALVRLLLEESLVEGTLPNMRHSALEYFVYTLRDRAQRRALLRFARRHYPPAQAPGPALSAGAAAPSRARSPREGRGGRGRHSPTREGEGEDEEDEVEGARDHGRSAAGQRSKGKERRSRMDPYDSCDNSENTVRGNAVHVPILCVNSCTFDYPVFLFMLVLFKKK
uniref:Opioid growth factor receptor (OGFr) conserved domain-containing protein n=1 Tax=Denticeps clupeoides TaxID=299321 RepID=A0AAY4D507_9TELE